MDIFYLYFKWEQSALLKPPPRPSPAGGGSLMQTQIVTIHSISVKMPFIFLKIRVFAFPEIRQSLPCSLHWHGLLHFPGLPHPTQHRALHTDRLKWLRVHNAPLWATVIILTLDPPYPLSPAPGSLTLYPQSSFRHARYTPSFFDIFSTRNFA
jgi:hypothetical protein